MDKRRNGVVLFITLSVIAAMLALVGVIFSYLGKTKDEAAHTAALIQADIFYRDTQDAIKSLMKKAGSDKEMKNTVLSTLYLAPQTLQPKESDHYATIDCKPLDNGVNINWLEYENNSSARMLYTMVLDVFDRLAESYNIADSTLLLGMIESQITGRDTQQRDAAGRLERKKGIINARQFMDIIRNYRFAADDESVENIAWEKYFVFDPESMMIDGNYLSSELIAILFDMELDSVRSEWFPGGNLQTFVSANGGDQSVYSDKLFSAEPVERMRCRISYGDADNTYAFGFDYVEGKADKFEFYGKQ